MIRLLVLFLTLVCAVPAAAAVTPDAPSRKPERTYVSKTTDSPNAAVLNRAFSAAERGNWSEVAQLQRAATDPVVRDLILWKRASEGVPGMTFEEIDAALTRLSDWPLTDRMRRRAEEIIELSGLNHFERIEWLEASGPRTGPGKVALAAAWRGMGEPQKADEILRDAWRNHSLERDLERAILARDGKSLTQDDHRARVDFLLWTNQRSAAEALKPLLSTDYRQLTDARIALANRAKRIDALVQAVPESLQDHPGLLYERARWRRSNKVADGVAPLLVAIDGKDIPSAGRGKLWSERALATREDLKTRNYTRAYRLASPHGMTAGADFAEAEWLSGWIAFRLNGDAARGLSHFQAMAKSVTSPVSVARGNYWAGRAQDVLKQDTGALDAYSSAARFKFTYYGQLAAQRIGDSKISLPAIPAPSPESDAAFKDRPVVKAMMLLSEAGQMSSFRDFAYFLDDQLTDPADVERLARLAVEVDAPDVGVRIGKAALQKGLVAPEAAYPVVTYPLLRQPKVERSLVYAITRQESEFNPRAVSRVGARGLMQFMPATAKAEARLRGMAYEQAWLTDDPAYNMTLGGLHLDTLLDQFNGSYIMTAAAYNAGPSRPRQWVDDYGDPRTGQIDPVDWVEFIPFSETRNYVQRVLENVQVYRHRLSGQPEDITLDEDLKRGRR